MVRLQGARMIVWVIYLTVGAVSAIMWGRAAAKQGLVDEPEMIMLAILISVFWPAALLFRIGAGTVKPGDRP